jgi:hypothetical protein
MKKVVVYLLGITLMVSCNHPPEAFQKALKYLGEKQYDKAIESFNLVKEEDKEWFDSAKTRKNNSFHLLLQSAEWKKIIRTLEKNKDDDDFFEYSIDELERNLTEKCQKGKSDSVLSIVDQYRVRLEALTDTNFTAKIIAAAEGNLFTGIWYGEKNLKNQEIVFKRQANSLNGLSNKSLNGWVENAVIYKHLIYQNNMQWKMNPKVFSESYYGSTSTYYAKKGLMTLISKDTLLIEYETLGRSSRFHRGE